MGMKERDEREKESIKEKKRLTIVSTPNSLSIHQTKNYRDYKRSGGGRENLRMKERDKREKERKRKKRRLTIVSTPTSPSIRQRMIEGGK